MLNEGFLLMANIFFFVIWSLSHERRSNSSVLLKKAKPLKFEEFGFVMTSVDPSRRIWLDAACVFAFFSFFCSHHVVEPEAPASFESDSNCWESLSSGGGGGSYPQVLGHVQQLLSQAAEGGQQQAHALIGSETSLRRGRGRGRGVNVKPRVLQ